MVKKISKFNKQVVFKGKIAPFTPFQDIKEENEEDFDVIGRIAEDRIGVEEFFEFGLKRRILFGHSRVYRKEATKKILLRNFKGMDIIHPEKCMASIKTAYRYLRTVNKRKLIVLCNSFSGLTDKIVEFCIKNEIPYIHRRWIGGLITNNGVLTKRYHYAKSKKKNMEEHALLKTPFNKKEESKVDRVLEEMKGIESMKALSGLTAFVFCCEKSKPAIKEFVASRIRVVGVCDTNFDNTPISYPIFANDDHHLSINFSFNILKKAIEDAE